MHSARHLLTTVFIGLFSFLNLPNAHACSCGEFPSFCGDAVYYNKLLVEIIDHRTATYSGGPGEYFTQVRIILDMDGGGYADTLSLINQNGWNCNGDVYGLPAGDSLIVSLPYAEVTTWPEELEGVPPYPTFDLFGCGVYYLHVVDGILGGGENQEAVQLEDFLNDPFNNCPIVLSAEEADPFSAVEVGPNPVSEELQIINFTREEIYFQLYTINGQPLSSLTLRADQVGKLPMEDLPAGVYILRQQAAQSEQSKLIVKS